ncbi:flagellar hook protein FlgE [Halochromatium glycolicum]|uniref:Flagellar hook protein FlgE n=1 Tax=Halochromatium glycolicum TaxID=85075 RepID=A0AAJ0X8U3_9GAMM|nr:flagellar hook protein FlgE [Halochromatium glycolicum]MBK1703325.1 hypothetical protein [Halochromatium glycolicum]
MSFSQALSGLRAQSESIKVISNNIANSQTVGFKGADVLFSDVFAGAASKVGLGVAVAGVVQDFRSGDLENTGRELDLAIAGQGFYRLEKPGGEVVYSRNGQFNQDENGFLVNGTGQFLTGYGLSDANDPFSEVIPGGAPQRLQITSDDIPANETAEVSAIYNLDASTETGVNLQTATVDDGAGNQEDVDFDFSSSFTAFDSLGNERTITTYFQKTGDNQWAAWVALDGVINGYTAAGAPGNSTFDLTFDSSGILTDTGAGNTDPIPLTFQAANYALDGAEDLDFELDLVGTTQFSNDSVQNSLTQDGYSSGSLVGIEIQEDGTVTRIFSNEERRDAGQIVLTNFINPEGLQPDGDNAWRQTSTSGEPVLGAAGTGVFGTIASGVLENSNVELAQQLVDLIVSQRSYQANSSSISTQDELLQTVINL